MHSSGTFLTIYVQTCTLYWKRRRSQAVQNNLPEKIPFLQHIFGIIWQSSFYTSLNADKLKDTDRRAYMCFIASYSNLGSYERKLSPIRKDV